METNRPDLTPDASRALAHWNAQADRYGKLRISDYDHDRAGFTARPDWHAIEKELTAAGYLEVKWSGEARSIWEQKDHYLTEKARAQATRTSSGGSRSL